MIRVNNIKIAAQEDQRTALENALRRILRLSPRTQFSFEIVKKSLDARKKGQLVCLYSADVAGIDDEAALVRRCRSPHITIAQEESYSPPQAGNERLMQRPVVVGAGPAGLFAALLLAEQGYRPLLLERGRDVDTRTADVERFWSTGRLDPCSNVQFGEGGAGAFSDGKLNSTIKDPRCREVLRTFVRFGAPREILYLAKPHIGTDRLKSVVREMREAIRAAGGEVRFQAKVTGLVTGRTEGHPLRGLTVNESETIPAEAAVLAIGHSARDTFAALREQGVRMQPKAFAVGLRVEHTQRAINLAQYGMEKPYAHLGAADYKLTYQASNGRAVYSFCMCPGGTVVAAASEEGALAVNGMSLWARDGVNANSALVVNVTPEDFYQGDVLDGVAFQRRWEQAAYVLAGADYRAPVQLVGDFLANRPTMRLGRVHPTYRPGVAPAELRRCLPDFAAEALREAIPAFGRKIRGFDAPEAVLTGVETRTSSPVRILRDADCQSLWAAGLYPCGEGAGYAGGILSAAVDGLRVAEQIIRRYRPLEARHA